jgi:adenylate kinase family enzyme
MQERLLARGQTSARTDDNLQTIKKRFVTFTNQTIPVIEYYEKQKKVARVLLFYFIFLFSPLPRLLTPLKCETQIDANRNADAVYADVRKAIAGVLPQK